MTVEFICEIGLNHDGRPDAAREMIEAARAAGADVAKFQTYIPEKMLRPSHPDFDLLKRLALPLPVFKDLARHCERVGIEFLSTPGDLDSLRFLVEECGMRRIKIGSDDLTYRALVGSAYETDLPVILSTGMATISEIGEALPDVCQWGRVTLMHCVSLYPCPAAEANLLAIRALRHAFPGTKVGYSDHTANPLAPLTAVALGAEVIECHVMLAKVGAGWDIDVVDAPVSYTFAQLARLIQSARTVEAMLGEPIKRPSIAERAMAARLRKGQDGRRGEDAVA